MDFNRAKLLLILLFSIFSLGESAVLLDNELDNELDYGEIIQEEGICSWYGADGEIPPGWPTACGDPFDRFEMAAAHKTLPCGTRIRVLNQENGRTVDVVVNDRGPFVPTRIVDLTYGAFGIVEENYDKGLFRCTYTVL